MTHAEMLMHFLAQKEMIEKRKREELEAMLQAEANRQNPFRKLRFR